MRRTKIVTHFGKAHRDEFLACCVVLFHEFRRGHLAYIERRLVSSSDLNDSGVWVIDTGERYEPEALNFDHHHIATDLCSLDMVMRHILGDNTYQIYRAVSPWLKSTAIHDNDGAQNAAEKLGMHIRAYMATRSPIEKFILDRFSEVMVVQPDTYLTLMMRDIGRMIIASAEEFVDTLPSIMANTPPPFDHKGIRVWDVRTINSEDSATQAMLNQHASTKGVDLMISSASRTTGGIGLYRQSWAEHKADLQLAKGHPAVKFVHKNGYYATTHTEVDDATILQIIDLAINLPTKHHSSNVPNLPAQ